MMMMCDVQALAAASKTVDFLKVVHGLHAYFLIGGDFDSKMMMMCDVLNICGIMFLSNTIVSTTYPSFLGCLIIDV